jgi:hypothetical protein
LKFAVTSFTKPLLDTYGTQVNVRKGMLVLVDKVVFHPQAHARPRIGCLVLVALILKNVNFKQS